MILIQPPGHLSNHISLGWYSAAGKGLSAKQVRLIPDGRHGLVVQHLQGRTAISEENGNPLPVGFVYGQSSAPFVNRLHGEAFTIGIFFRPHAVKDIFKIDADLLADGYANLDDLAGYRINEVLLNLEKPEKICRYLFDFIWKKLSGYGKTDRLIEDSFSSIQQNISAVSTGNIFKHYNISERQFQRRFKERAGIPLNTYIRVIKFQAALQLLHQQPDPKLSGIAYQLGYADQSHFTRDFKFFSGHTPKEVAAGKILFPENLFPGLPLQTRRHILF